MAYFGFEEGEEEGEEEPGEVSGAMPARAASPG